MGSQSEWPQQDSNIKRKDIQLILAATSRRKRLVSIRFLMTKVERLSCLRPSTECLFCLSHALLTKPEKSLWRTVITRSGWCGRRLSPKINSSQMPICARTHMRIYIRNGWALFFCQSKRKRTDLKTARQHQWLWHRSWLDGFELVLFAPLGKSVLALMSCSADTNAKTLNLSKQEYCKVWGEAL